MFNCPSCGSANTQKLSLVYASGTSSTRSTTVGAGAVGGHGALGLAATKSNNQTALAQQYGPPAKMDPNKSGCMAALGMIPALFVGAALNSEIAFFIVWALIASACFASTRKAMAYNRDEYPKRYAEWSEKLLCLRCGNIFRQG